MRRQSRLQRLLFCQPGSARFRGEQHTEEVDSALGVVTLISVVEFGARGAVELDLPCEGARPYDGGNEGDKSQTEEATRSPSEVRVVENEEADQQSSDDGPDTFQRCIQCAWNARRLAGARTYGR
jgi:hypothetical protein